MQDDAVKAKRGPKKTKAERRRGIMADSNRTIRGIIALVLAVSCAALTFTHLGFLGLGWAGEYVAYIIVLLLPIALAALLLGKFMGMCMGLFAGAVLQAHSIIMPLDFYEYTFVTPLTSIVMLGVAGLLLGALFSFALRNNPSPVRTGIYIAIVCIIVSWLYSIGFVINVAISIVFDVVSDASAGMSETQANTVLNGKMMAMILRMGSMGMQAWIDAALMTAVCIGGFAANRKARQLQDNIGLRGMFAARLSVVVFIAFMIVSAAAFASVTAGDINQASEDMKSEVNYLWNQMEHASTRIDVFIEFLSNNEDAATAFSNEQSDTISSLSAGSLLDGYSREADGTILVLAMNSGNTTEETAADGVYIALSDDDRFPVGEKLEDHVNIEVVEAITRSAQSGKLERTVYDQNGGMTYNELAERTDNTVRSEIAYLFAEQKDDIAIVIMYPARKVFAGRLGVMLWTALSAFVLLVVVFFVVFMLLDRVVARRIDETNGVLARITNGDLNARVEVRDTREFKSLSAGVNETVDALKGWIAEAESRMDAELATAKAIQESALPRVFPPFPDILKLDIYATMRAAREVGGDFYDFFLIGDESDSESGELGFIIADVSGKGVPAALFMMKSMTQLRDYLKAGVEVGEAVENANRQLCEGNDEGMFVTVWAGVLDYATGLVEYVNAGHNPPLLWQRDGGWRWLTEKSGMPLGLFDALPYESYSVKCGIGDQFLLYTDGVTEAMSADGELYGEERLEELLNADFTLHPRLLVDAVRRDVSTWARGAEQSDDITILALEVGVPPELTATMVIPADVDELPAVNEFIHSELDRRLCPKRVQNQLDIAVEELFVNVAHYAYPDATPDKPGLARVSYTYNAEPPSITVQIADDGIPYNPLEKPDAVTPDDINEVPIGGLGILMAKCSVNEMHYERTDGSNIVTILKKW